MTSKNTVFLFKNQNQLVVDCVSRSVLYNLAIFGVKNFTLVTHWKLHMIEIMRGDIEPSLDQIDIQLQNSELKF